MRVVTLRWSSIASSRTLTTRQPPIQQFHYTDSYWTLARRSTLDATTPIFLPYLCEIWSYEKAPDTNSMQRQNPLSYSPPQSTIWLSAALSAPGFSAPPAEIYTRYSRCRDCTGRCQPFWHRLLVELLQLASGSDTNWVAARTSEPTTGHKVRVGCSLGRAMQWFQGRRYKYWNLRTMLRLASRL